MKIGFASNASSSLHELIKLSLAVDDGIIFTVVLSIKVREDVWRVSILRNLPVFNFIADLLLFVIDWDYLDIVTRKDASAVFACHFHTNED